ncbi:MAG: hypothetical protein JST92_03180 [Deltaproteobacteria bacterium]|nr:hypothetical protein [Deltaproteobacteria bacterium]
MSAFTLIALAVVEIARTGPAPAQASTADGLWSPFALHGAHSAGLAPDQLEQTLKLRDASPLEAEPVYDAGPPTYAPVDGVAGVFTCTVQLSRVIHLTCSSDGSGTTGDGGGSPETGSGSN